MVGNPDGRRSLVSIQTLVGTLLLVCAAFVVLNPIISLIENSLEVGSYGLETHLGWDNWHRIITQPSLGRAIFNTISLASMRQLLGLVLGVCIAWLIARTNLPGRQWIEVGFWIALFMPVLPVTLSWVLLMGGRTALANKLMYGLPFVNGPVFSIYSWWGIVWVHMTTATLAIKVFLLVPAFRSMDSSLEEAARTSGASLLRVVWSIVVPIMTPTIIVVLLIGMIRSMQGFEIELILGAPARIDVYSTFIYREMNQEPPLVGSASALSVVFLLSLVPFVLLQQWFAHRRSYASVTGKFSSRQQDLGRWRWPLFGLMVLFLIFMTLIPFVFLLMGTFMKLFGIFSMTDPWTISHWTAAFRRGDIVRSFWNSIRLGLSSAVVGMIVFTTMAYMIVKTRYVARRTLDFLTWLPALVPGVVLSLGLLQMFASSAIFRPFYGTILVLILAIVIGTLTIGTQIIRGALIQLSSELEEAAWVAGGSRLYTFRRVVMPLIAPSIAVVGLEVFATATSAVAVIALLGTGATQPLSLLQLSLMGSGQFETAAVVGTLIMVLTVSAALVARHIGLRAGRYSRAH